MKKLVVVTAVVLAMGTSGIVEAAPHNTLSIGYAQTHFSTSIGSVSAPGVNVKYHWESNAGWGIIGSYAYAGKAIKIIGEGINQTFTAGPSWRFNDYFNVYALVGVGYGYANFETGGYKNINNWRSAFAYGAGIQINPIRNLAIDASYVYTKYQVRQLDAGAGTWMLGVGYRF